MPRHTPLRIYRPSTAGHYPGEIDKTRWLLAICYFLWASGHLAAQAENLSFHKPAWQLGTFEKNVAGRAVDGNVDHDLRLGGCAHPYSHDRLSVGTELLGSPAWWVVDLAAGDPDRSFIVTGVVIYNRGDCCPEHIFPATIRVGRSSPDVASHVVCENITHSFQVARFPCSSRHPVRYVSIVHSTLPAFTLCEVQVEGYPYVPAPSPAPHPSAGPSQPASFETRSETGGALSPGVIAGVSLGCFLLLVIVFTIAAWGINRRKKPKIPTGLDEEGPHDRGIALEDCRAFHNQGSDQLGSVGSSAGGHMTGGRGSILMVENHKGFRRLSRLVDYNSPASLSVKRRDLVERMLKLYWERPDLVKCALKVHFSGEPGVDWGGLTRDLFSTFWEGATQSGPQAYFKGADVACPYLPLHRMRKESWKFVSLGRILAHTAALTRGLPQKIACSSYIAIVFGSTVDSKCLMKDFFRFLPEDERQVVRKALSSFESLSDGEHEALIDFYSKHGLQVLPKVDDIKEQLMNVAEQVLVREPRELHELMRQGLPAEHYDAFWSNLSVDHISTQLKEQLPAGPELLHAIITPSDLTEAETKVLLYLRRYLIKFDPEQVGRFLLFVTGSRYLPLSQPVAITFSDLTGLQRRPVAHTCGNNLCLSIHYSSYQEFKREMEQYLHSEFSYNFSVC